MLIAGGDPSTIVPLGNVLERGEKGLTKGTNKTGPTLILSCSFFSAGYCFFFAVLESNRANSPKTKFYSFLLNYGVYPLPPRETNETDVQ